jgi:hypothetical protein
MPADAAKPWMQEKSGKGQDGKTRYRKLGRGSYTAHQFFETVTIRATGTLPNLQTEAQLVMSPIEIFPPEFILFFVEPPITNPATLPFDVQTTFSTTQVITEVSVHDADGRHEVPVIRL